VRSDSATPSTSSTGKVGRWVGVHSNFAAADLRRIAGAHSRDIATFLGSKDFDEAIHRDNLVMLRERTATTAP
jgi:Glutamate 5-kinase